MFSSVSPWKTWWENMGASGGRRLDRPKLTYNTAYTSYIVHGCTLDSNTRWTYCSATCGKVKNYVINVWKSVCNVNLWQSHIILYYERTVQKCLPTGKGNGYTWKRTYFGSSALSSSGHYYPKNTKVYSQHPPDHDINYNSKAVSGVVCVCVCTRTSSGFHQGR